MLYIRCFFQKQTQYRSFSDVDIHVRHTRPKFEIVQVWAGTLREHHLVVFRLCLASAYEIVGERTYFRMAIAMLASNTS